MKIATIVLIITLGLAAFSDQALINDNEFVCGWTEKFELRHHAFDDYDDELLINRRSYESYLEAEQASVFADNHNANWEAYPAMAQNPRCMEIAYLSITCCLLSNI